jgi:hypothetical protein
VLTIVNDDLLEGASAYLHFQAADILGACLLASPSLLCV